MRHLFLLTLVMLALAGCTGRENESSGVALDTIAPAKPLPAPTGTDAMTQTVDVESGRSENEGGGLTSPNPPVTVPGSTTSTTGTTTTTTGTTATTTR